MNKKLTIWLVIYLTCIVTISSQELQLKVIPWGQIKAEKSSELPWKDNLQGIGIGFSGISENLLSNIRFDYLTNPDKKIENSYMGFKSIVTGNIGFGYAISRKTRINFPILLHIGYSYLTQNKIVPSSFGLWSFGATAQCRVYMTHKICLFGEIQYNYEYYESDDKIILDLYELGIHKYMASMGIGYNLSKKENRRKSESILK